MSFSGHPVCHLGLNWCILLGLFIFFSALAKCLCCLLFPLGNKIRLIMHFKYQILYKIKITKCCLKWHYGLLFGILGTLYGIFYFIYKMFYLLLLLIFFLFQIKTCGFHLKEEGKELLGMLMAALANNNGYYVLYLFPLFFSNSQLLFLKLIGISQRC